MFDICRAIPGIGFKLDKELSKMGVEKVSDIRSIPREDLLRSFGPRIGSFLFKACRGTVSIRYLGAIRYLAVSLLIGDDGHAYRAVPHYLPAFGISQFKGYTLFKLFTSCKQCVYTP